MGTDVLCVADIISTALSHHCCCRARHEKMLAALMLPQLRLECFICCLSQLSKVTIQVQAYDVISVVPCDALLSPWCSTTHRTAFT